jgi:hypothetical protein
MGLSNQDNHIDLESLVKALREQRDWASEVRHLSMLMERLDGLNKVVSVRELAKLLNRSKTWIGVTLILAKGIRLYPEVEKYPNRNSAYEFLQKKNKLKRFLES